MYRTELFVGVVDVSVSWRRRWCTSTLFTTTCSPILISLRRSSPIVWSWGTNWCWEWVHSSGGRLIVWELSSAIVWGWATILRLRLTLSWRALLWVCRPTVWLRCSSRWSHRSVLRKRSRTCWDGCCTTGVFLSLCCEADRRYAV